MSKPWLYQLEHDYHYHSPLLSGVEFSNDWCRIADGTIHIRAGYAWNGCSYKWDVLGLFTLGTPDGRLHLGKPITYHASLVHDVLCRYKSAIPIRKAQAVGLFNAMLREVGFQPCWLYVQVVNWLGPQHFAGDMA